jgi:phenylalanine ammonia-lyase
VADLRRWRGETPDALAIIAEEVGRSRQEVSFVQYAQFVDQFTAALTGLGVGHGDVVVIQLPNRWQIPALMLACLRVGAIFAPVMTTVGPRELERILRRLSARVCVTIDCWSGYAHADALAAMSERLPKLRHRVVLGEANLPRGDVSFEETFERRVWADLEPYPVDPISEDPDRAAMVLFTSGTSGQPKGVVHSMNTLYAGAAPVVVAEEMGQQDRFLTSAALTHIFGTIYGTIMPLLTGGCAIMRDEWEPAKVLTLLSETEVTVFAGAPVFLTELLAAAERQRCAPSHLRLIFTGATNVPRRLITEAQRTFGVPLRTVWGMTETAGHTWTRGDDPADWGAFSDGRPGPGLEISLRSEFDISPERPGSLHVRGGGVCLATFGRDEGKLHVLSDHDEGWYDTGDLAVADGRGGIRMVGRVSDRVGGAFMVPVKDVETTLFEHPLIEDVAVVGYPDNDGGELVCAFIVTSASAPVTLRMVRAYLTTVGMTQWYQPSRVEIVDSLPRNGTGKVRKDCLRKMLLDPEGPPTENAVEYSGLGKSMRIILDGYTLALDHISAVASGATRCEIDISDTALACMASSVRVRDELVAKGVPIYGVTTGFGDSANRHLSCHQTHELQRNLLRFLGVGTGAAAPADVVRATMLIRANCAARGNSGIRAEPIRLILNMLREDILPVIPERGSVGASGDLAPLSYLASAVVGEGTVRWSGRETSVSEALRMCGLEPVTLQAKEGLALVNGTSFMSAYLALALAEANELAWIAEVCTAMGTELRRGSRDQFASFAHLHKPHRGQIHCAARIHGMLAESRLATLDEVNRDRMAPCGAEGIVLERAVQDPYSIRCAPHVIGVLHDTLEWSSEWVTTEVNSSNDNPLFDARTAMTYNSGNFYGGHIAQAAQAVATAVASVADLLDRQLALLVDEKFSLGLRANLTVSVLADDSAAGTRHGFKGAQIAASALTAEALHLTMPVSSFSRSTEAHNQDKVSMGTIAARHSRTVTRITSEVAAIHLLALCQAADLVGPDLLGAPTRRIYDYVRRHSPMVMEDRRLDADIILLAEDVRNGSLRRACKRRSNTRPLARQP